ncbi:MAG: tRNA preQ1(34) S-adenosylmethionine ribosyltransferase-isomerase QueA [Phycisphaerales bacterium]|nr:MAG: tRNA preQ1(34) S-adenosylmethionine ribosyltransferase-isomerase QueA [Phycisphaerales bacterium]
MQQDLPTSALDYELPESLIATRPAEPRDSARMLVMHRNSDEVEHRHVRDLPEYLRASDLMIFNDTQVIPARFLAKRIDTGGKVEGLFLNRQPDSSWQVMLRSNGRLRPSQRIELVDLNAKPSGHVLELVGRVEDVGEGFGGEWVVRPDKPDTALAGLEEVGRTPLPPYIRRARHGETVADERDRRWYQTVYADPARAGSVAAPTAGLHFTPRLLEAIDAKGVERRQVTLHVGAATFKPIAAATVQAHRMHTEIYEVPPQTLEALRRAKLPADGRQSPRVIAVGTTTVRTLESLPPAADLDPNASQPITGETDLLIAPPYEFRHVDGMLTNFHLPRSTLLALVAAFVTVGGLDRLLAVYAEAVARAYRFYSYGDAMLILP